MGMKMDSEAAKAIEYAQKLLDAAIAVVEAARVELNENGARDPKVIGLTLLCRSISNFRATVRLVQQSHVMEARALVRCLYENLLWMGALSERGLAFVQDMVADEGFNRKALGDLTLKMSAKYGLDVGGAENLALRGIIKEMAQQFPEMKKLRADKTASEGAVEAAYVEYMRLSLDAVHCSVTSLGRHVTSGRAEGRAELTVTVEAKITPAELLGTVEHACRAPMGTAVGANELLGFTNETRRLGALVSEFEKSDWVRGEQ
jgi:hypothetical protein